MKKEIAEIAFGHSVLFYLEKHQLLETYLIQIRMPICNIYSAKFSL